jgi:hypothetical protein
MKNYQRGFKMEKFEIDRLNSEIKLINEILDMTSNALNNNSRLIIMDFRLKKQIRLVNLQNQLRNVEQ